MSSKEIEELLERYYEGETTLAEEEKLRAFFLTEKIPPHLAEHASFFRFQTAEMNETTDPDFEEKLLLRLEEEIPVVSLHNPKRKFYFVVGMAAGLIILAGLFFTFQSDLSKDQIKDQDVRIAYEQTQKALLLLSANLNTGLNQVQKFQTFEKGLKQVQNFSAFSRYQILIINPDDNNRPKNNLQ